MKRKMAWIVGAVIVLVGVIIGIAAGRRASGQQEIMPLGSRQEGGAQSMEQTGVAQLIAEVKSEEEAQELAALYGITLKRVNGTLAIFETTEDPMSIIQKGKENGWKILEMDTIYYFNDNTVN